MYGFLPVLLNVQLLYTVDSVDALLSPCENAFADISKSKSGSMMDFFMMLDLMMARNQPQYSRALLSAARQGNDKSAGHNNRQRLM